MLIMGLTVAMTIVSAGCNKDTGTDPASSSASGGSSVSRAAFPFDPASLTESSIEYALRGTKDEKEYFLAFVEAESSVQMVLIVTDLNETAELHREITAGQCEILPDRQNPDGTLTQQYAVRDAEGNETRIETCTYEDDSEIRVHMSVRDISVVMKPVSSAAALEMLKFSAE